MAQTITMVYFEECIRCGKEFEKDEPEEQLVCPECLFNDWHEEENDAG